MEQREKELENEYHLQMTEELTGAITAKLMYSVRCFGSVFLISKWNVSEEDKKPS